MFSNCHTQNGTQNNSPTFHVVVKKQVKSRGKRKPYKVEKEETKQKKLTSNGGHKSCEILLCDISFHVKRSGNEIDTTRNKSHITLSTWTMKAKFIIIE